MVRVKSRVYGWMFINIWVYIIGWVHLVIRNCRLEVEWAPSYNNDSIRTQSSPQSQLLKQELLEFYNLTRHHGEVDLKSVVMEIEVANSWDIQSPWNSPRQGRSYCFSAHVTQKVLLQNVFSRIRISSRSKE